MTGKTALMAGAAALALVAFAQAGLAAKKTSDGTSAPVPAAAQVGPSNAELEARVKALEDQIQENQDKAQADHGRLSALEQNFNYTTWTFDNARPTVSSGDGRFTMALRARFQLDLANFMQEDPAKAGNTAQYKDLSNGLVVRRAFLGIEGKAFNDFWYELRYNGGGSASESTALSIARIAYVGIPHLRINLGIIEPAFMLEGTTSSGQLMFMERPEIDNIGASAFGGGDGRRGVEVAYQYENLLLPGDNFILTGAYTGQTIGSSTGHGNKGDEATQLLGHLSYRVWSDGISNVVFGGDYATANTLKSSATFSFGDTPQIRVDNTKLIGTPSIAARHSSMYAFNGSFNIENFYLGGEYANFEVDRKTSAGGGHPNFSGWYVEGSWILTGETKLYNANATNNEIGGWAGPKVANPFSWAGDSWGAWELVTRYSDTNLNWNEDQSTGVVGGEEKIVNVGINWYLNQVVRLGLYGEYVNVDKKKAYNSTVKYGQDLEIVGLRLQFSN
jgi:phosphate-selective porin OprO and OprP